MDVRVAVASHSLGSGFSGLMYAAIGKLVGPGQSIVEQAIVMRDDPAFLRDRLRRLLEGTPRPVALIGICIRPDPETVSTLRQAGIPVVLIDEAAAGVSTVASDSRAGGYMAARHLLEIGCRSPAVVAGQLDANGGYNAVLRVKGFQQALAERGVPFAWEDVVQAPDYSRREGTLALATLLGRGRAVDGVFCAAGDVCATGLLAGARERKLRVPGELAIVGYDDHPLAALSHPPLTTLRQPIDELATRAWQLATEQTAEILARPAQVLLPPTLVQRSTTAALAPGPHNAELSR